MAQTEQVVIGGVDTHKDIHVAEVIDEVGKILDTKNFPTAAKGYIELLCWMRSFGELARVGVEGTGCYGAGLSRHLGTEEVEVLEVNRPNRRARRLRGSCPGGPFRRGDSSAKDKGWDRPVHTGAPAEALVGTKLALRALSHRYQSLSAEMSEAEAHLGRLTAWANPALRGVKGIGPDVASILLTAARENLNESPRVSCTLGYV